MKKTIFTYILLPMMLLTALAACEDDFRPGYGSIGDGEAVLDVCVNFDMEPSVDLNTGGRGVNGDAIQNVNSFWIVMYSVDGSLLHKFKLYDGSPCEIPEGTDIKITNFSGPHKHDNRLPDEVESGFQDSSSDSISFTMAMPSGRYYIYGVANVPDFERYDVSTREKLKAIDREWDLNNIANNSEMFGMFSNVSNRQASDDSPVPVSMGRRSLHCWLRRLASKVTVAFDGNDLYDDVQIFVTKVVVRDIPKRCSLGNPNTAGLKPGSGIENHQWYDPMDRYKVDNGVIFNGDSVVEQDLSADIKSSADLIKLLPGNYPHVCNGDHCYFGQGEEGNDPSILVDRHSHTSPKSLFFYENLQFEGTKSKYQDADGDNEIDYENPKEGDLTSGWKDHKAYGTYVEVRGFYRSTTADGHVGSGPIKYRFMLGKDTDKDFNVERNTHYKLTLKFKGYGNDADWHIEYSEPSGLYTSSPQFISYLYNQKMMATVKIVGEVDPSNPYLYATILGSDIPSDFPKSGDPTQENIQTYWRPWGNDSPEYPNPDLDHDRYGNSIYYRGAYGGTIKNGTLVKDGPWNSFLSFRPSEVIRITDAAFDGLNMPSHSGSDRTSYNKTYFDQRSEGYAKYNVNVSSSENDEYGLTGRYAVSKIMDGKKTNGYVFNIPLYTRPKELITKTGFTGMNPYDSYPRCEQIRFSAKVKNETTGNYEWKYVYLDMMQVRRIENPKGVWRKAGSTEGFHVTLMHMRDAEATTEYSSFTSSGKWSAEVVGNGNNVTLSTTSIGSGDMKPMFNVRRIEGESEQPVDFMINFNGNVGCAIVRVRYHNYTCEHDIFCRTGYDPVQITPDGDKWSSFNVYRFDENKNPILTESPLEAGSFFRRASYTAILEKNDKTYPFPGDNNKTPAVAPGDFKVLELGKTTESNMSWANCAVKNNNALVKKWTIGGTSRIATIDDFYSLATPDGAAGVDFPIKKAYGVLYGDGATETQTIRNMAHGYTREDGTTSQKGMRGVFVYNDGSQNSNMEGNQIFLPVGATGYGRRKGMGGWQPSPKDEPGTLRYASRTSYNVVGILQFCPLFWDIFCRPGAIYWCKERNSDISSGSIKKDDNPYANDDISWSDVRKSASFEMNYFTMGFEGFENSSCNNANGSDSDAIFIRTVIPK